MNKISSDNRLTDKKMANSKFRKNEEKLLEAFFEGDSFARPNEVAKRAGVARSTFYRHHATVGHITRDYKEYVLTRYRRLVRKLLKNKRAQIRAIYLRTLIFIVKHQREFVVVIRGNGRSVFEEMLAMLREKIVSVTYLPTYDDKAWRVYRAEVIEVLWRWGEQGFKITKMNRVLGDIMYLTKTAKARLGEMSGDEVES